jgi:predicted Holliday junction resolvase-like endonuclease
MNNYYDESLTVKYVAIIASILLILFVITLIAAPSYNVYSREMSGKAQLREAEWNKQIAIEEARALKESALLKAEAEVIRADGVARANEIIGSSLKDNEAYLRYLWINALYEDSNSIIYVPTEANLPILESSRIK